MAHTAIDIEFDRDRNLPRVVIARDYSGNVNITHFDDQNFPSELKESGIGENQLKNTIQTLNAMYRDAETSNWTTFIEGCLGCLTLFSIFLCYQSHYRKMMRRIDNFLRNENENIYLPKGWRILNPLYNGLLEIEIVRIR